MSQDASPPRPAARRQNPDWTVIGVGVSLAGLMLFQSSAARSDHREDMREVRAEIAALREGVNRNAAAIAKNAAAIERNAAAIAQNAAAIARNAAAIEANGRSLARIEEALFGSPAKVTPPDGE